VVAPAPLWVTDITEHPTREGKVHCAVVLDAWSRRVIGLSIDSTPSTALVTNALGMTIDQRRPPGETIIHSDQGTQFSSWAFTRRAVDSGLLPSMGSVVTVSTMPSSNPFGAGCRRAARGQRWTTRLELANAVFEYLEIFHNRRRRHSSLTRLTPTEFEARHQPTPAARRGPVRWMRCLDVCGGSSVKAGSQQIMKPMRARCRSSVVRSNTRSQLGRTGSCAS
jgi:transposase InsO family protein